MSCCALVLGKGVTDFEAVTFPSRRAVIMAILLVMSYSFYTALHAVPVQGVIEMSFEI